MSNSLIKDYDKDIPERPFKIYWHGKFLRSYSCENEFKQGLKFFSGFLIEITFKEK